MASASIAWRYAGLAPGFHLQQALGIYKRLCRLSCSQMSIRECCKCLYCTHVQLLALGRGPFIESFTVGVETAEELVLIEVNGDGQLVACGIGQEVVDIQINV